MAMAAQRPPKEARLREKAKEVLLGMGFFEVINYAFQPERWTALLFGEAGDREFDTKPGSGAPRLYSVRKSHVHPSG